MKWTDNGGGGFAPAPVGTHVARCIKIIDIGTQRGEYQGSVTIRRQCIIGWELPTELIETGELAGKPFGVSKFYTQSLNEKATLRKDLENWRGRAFSESELAGFDSRNILGKPCLVSVIHTDKGKAKVAGVMALPKAMQVPDQVNPSVYFSLEPGEFDRAIYDSLTDGFKKLIASSPEYQQLTNNGNGAPAEEDDWQPGDPEPSDDDRVPF